MFIIMPDSRLFEEKKQLLQLLWKPYKFFIFNFANIDIDQVLIRAVQNLEKLRSQFKYMTRASSAVKYSCF